LRAKRSLTFQFPDRKAWSSLWSWIARAFPSWLRERAVKLVWSSVIDALGTQ